MTTVLSMNAMLEPRMVAARIRGLPSGLHGTPSTDDWLMASQGVLTEAMDDCQGALGSAEQNVGGAATESHSS